MDSLSFAEESVAILVIHSILQYGPLRTDKNEIFDSWCSESHEQLLEDYFIDEFIARLERRLDGCQLSWKNELVLMVITMITMRILTVCDLTRDKRVADLAIKCRRAGENWIVFILENIQKISSSHCNELIKLRLKMVNIGISCVLTFSTHRARIDYLLSSNEHIVSLLKAATTIRDNIILNMNQSNTSNFVKNMMRLTERVLFMLQPKITEILEKSAYQSLNDFATIYWAVILINGTMDGKWQKRTNDPYTSWYDCRYESRQLSIDCSNGTFLIDGMTIGFLA
ncbi:unnamed protein product [Rotaria sp. Silwood2]|nr:unnamed protein product [Rotaria sp. Silwood2]CAF2902903.1 unnamed protein product [Rotaria sp. Silwood2]CAF4309812.1 unnamed protein product [Rotaria sp. Silwood2]CAF4476640.1 unnamed protein product [Rotaria sp. Silwood2]